VPALPPVVPQPGLAPQWPRSVIGSTHVPPQLICEPGHDTPQLPLLQTVPPVQCAPALLEPTTHPAVAPQKLGLVRGSMQVPLQLTRPI